MKSLILLAASAVFAGGSMAAVDLLADPDKDGKIYPEEFRASRLALLKQADTDKDGRISRTEAESQSSLIRAELEARGSDRADKVGSGKFFDRIDADGDGYISQPEMTRVLNVRFTMVDTNRDGFLDAAEASKLGLVSQARRP